ncbi:MAG: YceI family protein [Chitinophagaceae bacterium]|nr:YceI family protein [Chitinophagaceae bacterium]
MKNKLLLFFLTLVYFQAIDAQSAVTFSINNFGIATKGTLGDLKTKISWNPQNLAASSLQATVSTATINTGIQARDNHLKKSSYFDVANFPTISMASTVIKQQAENIYLFERVLTIKGKSEKIQFPFTVKKIETGNLFEGSFEINRRDFNVGGSSLSLSDKVRVQLRVSY